MTDSQNKPRGVGNLEWHLVAYIDLLGQSNQLSRFRRLPTNEAEAEEVRQAIRQSAGQVYQIRSFFEGFFHHLVNVNPESLDRVPAEQRESFLRARTIKLNQLGFSDSFVISTSLHERGEVEGPSRAAQAMWAILVGVAGVSLLALSRHIPLRGGITVGTGVELFEREAYGPALVDAYRLETELAEYPRVVIGQGLFDYLTYLENLPPTTSFNIGAATTAMECRQLFCAAPDDGQQMLHILSPVITRLPTRDGGTWDELRAGVVQWVHAEANRFAQERNEKLRNRYVRLSRYLDASAATADLRRSESGTNASSTASKPVATANESERRDLGPQANREDALIYANCMSEVRQRLDLIKWLAAGNRVVHSEFFFTTELIFLQFRKVLELVAFASLTANREKYLMAYQNASNHWRAKNILDSVERINPEFYPRPLVEPVVDANGVKMFTLMASGFLTKDEFVQLYDVCGELLHARNPFSEKPTTTSIGHSVDEWVQKCRRLLAFHSVRLINGDVWIAVIPSDGPVRVSQAEQRAAD